MNSKSLLILLVVSASLLSLTHSVTLSHDYYQYTLFDYINGRRMYLSKCYLVLPPDTKDIFTWHPSNISINGPCGVGNCSYTLTGLNFTLGTCSGNLTKPCTTYETVLKKATRITLVSNLINFFNGPNPSPIFVLENAP